MTGPKGRIELSALVWLYFINVKKLTAGYEKPWQIWILQYFLIQKNALIIENRYFSIKYRVNPRKIP